MTLAGTQLTVQVGSNQYTGDYTPIAYLGVTQVSAGPTFALQGPNSVSVGQGQYSTADVFTILIGGFNSAINLSAAGGPAGTTVSFQPEHDPCSGRGHVNHDGKRSQQRAFGELSFDGYRQRGRNCPERVGCADGYRRGSSVVHFDGAERCQHDASGSGYGNDLDHDFGRI